MPAGAWFVDRKGRRLGPYSERLLRQAAARKSLRPDDLVQQKGETHWRRADEVPGLFPRVPTATQVAAPSSGARRSRRPAEEAAPANYLMRHWRGELPLRVSYWVNGVTLALVLGTLFTLLASADSLRHLPIEAAGRRILELLAATVLVAIWQYVGIWRAAGHHVAEGGQARWARAARIAAALSFFEIGVLTVRQMPTIREAFELASGHDRVPPSQIRVVNGGTEIEISGGLSFGTTDRLQATLDATPTARLIQLNDSGGWITEGQSLGELIAKRGLATFTPRECDSACLLAFMGGNPRYIGARARLGFHEASIGGVGGGAASAGTEQMRRNFRGKGIPDAFIERALSTPAASIWYPTTEELIAAHVINGVVDERQYATTGVQDWQDPLRLEADFLEVPIFAALKRAEPVIYRRLEALYVSGIQNGTPQSEMTAKAHAIMVREVIPKYLRQGADTALLAYWKSQLAIAGELRALDPGACATFMFPNLGHGETSIFDRVSSDARDAERRSLVNLLDATRAHPESAPSESAIRDSLREVTATAERQFPGSLKLLANPTQSASDPVALCRAALNFYASVTDLPVDQAAAVMRFLASRSAGGGS